jgi:hypothetical protein
MHASLLHQDTFCYAEENGEPHGGASSRTVPRVHVALWWKAIKAQLWADHEMAEFFVSITTIYSISPLFRCYHPCLVGRCVISEHLRAEGPWTQSARDDHHNGRAECTHDPRCLSNGAEDIEDPGKK